MRVNGLSTKIRGQGTLGRITYFDSTWFFCLQLFDSQSSNPSLQSITLTVDDDASWSQLSSQQ